MSRKTVCHQRSMLPACAHANRAARAAHIRGRRELPASPLATMKGTLRAGKRAGMCPSRLHPTNWWSTRGAVFCVSRRYGTSMLHSSPASPALRTAARARARERRLPPTNICVSSVRRERGLLALATAEQLTAPADQRGLDADRAATNSHIRPTGALRSLEPNARPPTPRAAAERRVRALYLMSLTRRPAHARTQKE